jgi:large subunit ribosomal protein L10
VLREKKLETVEKLKGLFSSNDSVFMTHYHGLSVAQINGLRSKMRANKIEFLVAKNSLTRLGVKGSEFEDLTESFSGPIAIAVSNDPVATAKILVEFAKDNEQLKLLGAKVFGGKIDFNGIKSLSTMPSLDELRAKLISLIQTPARSLAVLMAAPASQAARVLSAYSNKSQ